MRTRLVLPYLVCLLFGTTLLAADGKLSDSDIAQIREVHKRYESTWLSGDSDGVRALFTDDSVLLPPHSGTPRIGRAGMDAFWFPAGAPPTKVTKLEVIIKDIGGDGQIAYVWGTDEVAWITEQDGKQSTSSHKGTFLNLLKKQPNGEWKISHHMWDDEIAKR
jgi:uncharacterized protein (TIGR02246 family)